MSYPYRVPWIFIRPIRGRTYVLDNLSDERLTGVTVTLFGRGLMPVGPPATVDPGMNLELTIYGDKLAENSVGVVRWFRPDGSEWLWRVAF
jgi:hypothetical protein